MKMDSFDPQSPVEFQETSPFIFDLHTPPPAVSVDVISRDFFQNDSQGNFSKQLFFGPGDNLDNYDSQPTESEFTQRLESLIKSMKDPPLTPSRTQQCTPHTSTYVFKDPTNFPMAQNRVFRRTRMKITTNVEIDKQVNEFFI